MTETAVRAAEWQAGQSVSSPLTSSGMTSHLMSSSHALLSTTRTLSNKYVLVCSNTHTAWWETRLGLWLDSKLFQYCSFCRNSQEITLTLISVKTYARQSNTHTCDRWSSKLISFQMHLTYLHTVTHTNTLRTVYAVFELEAKPALKSMTETKIRISSLRNHLTNLQSVSNVSLDPLRGGAVA